MMAQTERMTAEAWYQDGVLTSLDLESNLVEFKQDRKRRWVTGRQVLLAWII